MLNEIGGLFIQIISFILSICYHMVLLIYILSAFIWKGGFSIVSRGLKEEPKVLAPSSLG